MDPVSRAQSSNISEKSLANLKPWKKGQTGNPAGRPKKLHVTRIYERLLAKSQNRQEIAESLMATLTSKGMAKVLLLREMAERTEGKVAQEISVDGNITLSLAETIAKRRNS